MSFPILSGFIEHEHFERSFERSFPHRIEDISVSFLKTYGYIETWIKKISQSSQNKIFCWEHWILS